MRIGSLCSGYEGIGMAVETVFPDAELAWVSDIDKGACKVLAHRYPNVPNIGDMTAVDWAQVEPVDVITGGTPCQDLSHAGKRAGMTEGTRSNLWVSMREAIATINPALVVWENVGGAYSAAAASDLESREGCVGDGSGRPVLRALGRVLGDLASLGYVGGWCGLRAADVGAPHGRLRVFVVAWPAGTGPRIDRVGGTDRRSGVSAGRHGLVGPLLPSDTNGPGHHGEGGLDLRTAVTLMPTPRATDGTKGGPNQRGSSGDLMLPSAVARMLPTPTTRDHKDHTIRREPHRPDDTDTLARALTDVPAALLPTPAVNDMGRAYTPETWDEWCAKQREAHGNGNGHGKSLEIEAQRLLPPPAVADTLGGRKGRSGDRSDELLLNGIAAEQRWGDYAAAITRWERALGRPAPAPTMLSTKGNPQLSPRFTEWMMGLPDGWITDVPGITRNEALKLCGNGVVPQQAAAALGGILGTAAGEVA